MYDKNDKLKEYVYRKIIYHYLGPAAYGLAL